MSAVTIFLLLYCFVSFTNYTVVYCYILQCIVMFCHSLLMH